jgi:cell division protein FtsB
MLANRLQAKQKENEALLTEIKQLKEKIDNLESEMKFHKRMIDKTNQPYSFMI